MTRPSLVIDPNLSAPDDFYEQLIDMHRDLSAAQSQTVNASLILLLANHIGDASVLADAMRRARAQVEAGAAPTGERAAERSDDRSAVDGPAAAHAASPPPTPGGLR
ncbi:MAG: DUF2783 domain-containing protein [Lautropia sp.]